MQTPQSARPPARTAALAPSPLWATLAPLACAVHCAATPLLVVVAPAVASSVPLEILLFGTSLAYSAAAVGAGTSKHGRGIVRIPVALGLALWVASLGGAFQLLLAEPATTAAASLMVAGGLFWNARLLSVERRRCRCAHCEESSDPSTTEERGRSRGTPLRPPRA